jgi:C-terminal processing protease CtpA/Prc
MTTRRRLFLLLFTTLVLFSLSFPRTSAQKATKFDIEQWRDVLRNVKQALKANYYDSNFHGMDVEARFDAADAKMKNAESLGQLVGIVAQVLLDLNDSHTSFVPPYNKSTVDYGWRMQAVGPDCFIGAVRPGSDAEAKGLHVGDKVLSIDGRPLDRNKVWLATYLYETLRPQPAMTLVIEKPGNPQQQVTINAKVHEATIIESNNDWLQRERERNDYYRLTRHRFYDLSDDVVIWKMPGFDLSAEGLEHYYGKWKNRKALILDLRGNEGGYSETLERLAGYFFTSDIKIAERRGRKKLEPMLAKSQKDKGFKGQLIVLIDADSASAAEIFARVMQLEKRGVVIGDRSSGMVMESQYYPLRVGVVQPIGFGISATTADVIMTDGQSLEHVGVTPDELLLPTPEEMSLNYDPVLARAAALVGAKLDAKKAGELFPIEWKSN